MRFSDLKNLITRSLVGYSVLANGRRLYLLTIAISQGTSTTAPAGSIGVTSHTTGLNKLFISNGAVWNVLSGSQALALGLATVATTGNTDGYIHAPFAGKLVAAVFSAVDALTQDASNYVTFSLTNITNSNAAMLAATDANTTKTTTGSAIAANTARALTLHGTAANLLVSLYDRLRFRAAATGTLGNTLTFPSVLLVFERAV